MEDEERPPRPTTSLDIVVVALIGVGGAMMIGGNMVILWNRDYRPIKTKSVLLTVLSSVGGVIWILAALVVNGHFSRKAELLSVCPLWTYWLQACFGFSLWLNCLTIRLITLYRIFICKRNGRGFNYLLLLFLVPLVCFCIVATVRKQIRFKKNPGSDEGDCKFIKEETPWAYGLIAFLVLYFLIFLGFAFTLRKTVSPLNEYRVIRRGGILSLFLFLLSMVTLKTRTYVEPVGRCLLSAAVASTIFYYFWARNSVVIYQVLFYKEEYLNKFIAELRMSPSQHERETRSSSVSKMNDQLIKIRAEVAKSRDRINELEDEVRALEQNCTSLESKNSLKPDNDVQDFSNQIRREDC